MRIVYENVNRQGNYAETSTPMGDSGGYLTPEQFDYLIGYANNERDKVLLTFLFYTGRRVSEVVRCLTPRDFNFRDNMVYFTLLKRKGLKANLNVNSKTMAMMNDYISSLGIGEDDIIFTINRFRVDQIIKEMGKKAGLLYVGRHKIHAHTLRHSFAVMAAKSCQDLPSLRKLQTLLGHANINMTSWYIDHFNEKEMRDFVEKIK